MGEMGYTRWPRGSAKALFGAVAQPGSAPACEAGEGGSNPLGSVGQLCRYERLPGKVRDRRFDPAPDRSMCHASWHGV